MATYEGKLKLIETKIKLLKLTDEETQRTIEKEHLPSLERQQGVLKTKLNEVHNLKVEIQELKFQNDEKTEEIREWSTGIERQVIKLEENVAELERVTMELNRKALEKAKRDEEYVVEQMKQKQFEREMKFEEEKFERRMEYEKKIDESRLAQSNPKDHVTSRSNTKLPKLVISKFNGDLTDWLRFWNQFEAEIEAAEIPIVTKFSYLKELLEAKVRGCVDGLPLTSEGYERAKSILKTKYGKTSEIVNAYIQNILLLPRVQDSNPTKIHDFYEKLLSNAQSLETLGKLKEITGYVRMTIDKLEAIRGDLVRTDDAWQDWKFPELIEALRKWTVRNPIKTEEKKNEYIPPSSKKSRSFQTKQQEFKPKPCVYCENTDHKPAECKSAVTVDDRKKILSSKQLCFNCTGKSHKASECRSQLGCRNCKRRHHTSICDRKSPLLVATGEGAVAYPVVVVEVDGIMCRALLDTGAGSSYASATLLARLNTSPVRKEYRRIEMMMQSSTKMIEVHQIKIDSLEENFHLDTEVTKVDRDQLLSLPNPRYKEMIEKFTHLKGIKMQDVDDKPELPVHLILGASEYAKVKTENGPRIGQPGHPVAEFTRFGWTLISPGTEIDLSNMFATQTSTVDYENLCNLDVLGLKDAPTGDQQSVYEDFKEQLTRRQDGSYETGLPWKGCHPPLPSNETGSRKRLNHLVRKLEKQPGMLQMYDDVIRDQLSQGIVEKATEQAEGREFYIPHKPVVRETAESTKLRIVYDASARESEKAPSLNECLETGPSLQNLLWSVLVRNRFYPVAIAGDLKQAFLQVWIKAQDRDAMRFHWFSDVETKQVETLRFTRALFGLAPSPFLLGGVIEQHLELCKERFPAVVEEIKRNLYVDDLIGGGETSARALQLKETSQVIFGEANFELHKWHSNDPNLEVANTSTIPEEQSYAKEQLGVKQDETKLLGLPWKKSEDTIAIKVSQEKAKPTRRGILGTLARIYDPLGLVSPISLVGKMLYREVCENQKTWDTPLPAPILARWLCWEKWLPDDVTVPRSLVSHREGISEIQLHAFGDASGNGVSTAVYAVVQQPSGSSQGLVAAKSRLAKQGLTIPRQELISGHMSTNLVHNVKEALVGFPVTSVYGWLDSTVALHWINGNGDYKQFVRNRVKKIQEKQYIQWRHVPTAENPADIGSRGGSIQQLKELWWTGPSWLQQPECWPPSIVTSPTPESESEAKIVREVLAVAVQEEDTLDEMMAKYDYWKAIRITAWVARFLSNCKLKDPDRIKCPLKAEEIKVQINFWIKRVQDRGQGTKEFEEDRQRLNLQRNDDGLFECRGRIQGDYPVYLPDKSTLAEKLVMKAHIRTLHGGVGLVMTKIRKDYWIPRLRSLSKRVIRKCYGCKRHQATAFAQPPPGNLPRDRTEGSWPFQVVGIDYAGPIMYRAKKGQEKKSYILLYACSLTRALYLELLPDLTTKECIRSLKRLIARRGRPDRIYSDNGKTFVAAAKWLRKAMRDEQLYDWLAEQEIVWQFNLSRAPWWGGQFERMVGLVKQAFYKTTGKANLSWGELEEVLLDVEITLNHRPLSYVEDDVQMPILTPHAMIVGRPNLIPESAESDDDDTDLRKRAKYLQRCKDAWWSRWSAEYLKALRERHNLKNKVTRMNAKVGDVVLIKGDERNRGRWKIGVIEKLIKGRDGIVRAVRLRAGKSFLERTIQHLYPMELSCDRANKKKLDATVREFTPRRRAATIARENIRRIADEEDEEQ